MSIQNRISVAMIFLGLALIFYFSRNGILRAMAHSTDLFVVIAVMAVVNVVLAVSLTLRVRTFINQYAKHILKIGIAMMLFSFFALFAPLVIIIPLNMTVNLPDHYFDAVAWTDFGIGGLGILIAMLPSHVKFFEYLLAARRS